MTSNFAAFCGFDFSPMLVNKMKDVTDKFRPIELFQRGNCFVRHRSIKYGGYFSDFDRSRASKIL
jgi:hypothetical protein